MSIVPKVVVKFHKTKQREITTLETNPSIIYNMTSYIQSLVAYIRNLIFLYSFDNPQQMIPIVITLETEEGGSEELLGEVQQKYNQLEKNWMLILL